MIMAKTVVTSPEVIQDKEFDGGAPLTIEDWSIFTVENFDNLGPVFLNKWEDHPGVLLTGEISVSGAHIDRLNLVLVGKIFPNKPGVIAAEKIWNFKEKNIFLKIETIELKKFKFVGKTYSDLLDSSELAFGWLDDNNKSYPLLDVVKQGFDGFSLRAVVAPDSTYSAKLYLYIYPYCKKSMLEKYKLATRIEFPAVLLTCGTAELGPQQAGFILEKNTGNPVIPAVTTVRALKETGRCPPAGELSWKVAALFSSVVLPETRSSGKTLWDRMKAVNTEGESQLKGVAPARLWPPSVKPVENTGECDQYNINYMYELEQLRDIQIDTQTD